MRVRSIVHVETLSCRRPNRQLCCIQDDVTPASGARANRARGLAGRTARARARTGTARVRARRTRYAHLRDGIDNFASSAFNARRRLNHPARWTPTQR